MVIIPSFVVDTALLLLSSTLLRFPIGFLIRKDQTSQDGCVWHRLSPSPPPPIPEGVRSPQGGHCPILSFPPSTVCCSAVCCFGGRGGCHDTCPSLTLVSKLCKGRSHDCRASCQDGVGTQTLQKRKRQLECVCILPLHQNGLKCFVLEIQEETHFQRHCVQRRGTLQGGYHSCGLP